MAEHQQPKVKAYFLIFAALIALTTLTVWASTLHLAEPWHLLVGLLIASAKAVLVILIFMHVYYSSRMTWVVVLGSLFWLIFLLIGITMTDYVSRGWQVRTTVESKR